jgi:hypothetical protein
MKCLTIILATCTLLSACASYHTDLANSLTGQHAYCNASGFGLLGSLIATSEHSQCVATYQKQGFSVQEATK